MSLLYKPSSAVPMTSYKHRSKRSKRSKRRKKTTKRRGDDCEYIPCGSSMNKCRPSYCYPESSRNWTLCNMSNWSKDWRNFSKHSRRRYSKLRRHCQKEKSTTTKMQGRKERRPRHTVDAITLHNKMPYIWRHLRPGTRKQMIRLANAPKDRIDIPGHIFAPSGKKNEPQFAALRRKYKSI